MVLLKLVTDEGIGGVGVCINWSVEEIFTIGQCGNELKKIFLIEQNPFDIEKMLQRIFAYWHDFHKPSTMCTSVLSAFEMVFWGIVNKKLGQLVYNPLGGKCHEKLRGCAGMKARTPEEIAANTMKMAEKSLTGVKFDPYVDR